MAFWKYLSKNWATTDPLMEPLVKEITCEEVHVLDGDHGNADQDGDPVDFIIFLTRGYKSEKSDIPRKMRLTRTDNEIAKLVEDFHHSPIDHWIEYSDRVTRNHTQLDPSILRIIDTEVYDHRYRSATGDWYFRRELRLSQATYDKIWEVLETRFSAPTPKCSACAVLKIDGITRYTVKCERPYSGSVLRKTLGVKTLRLRPGPDTGTDNERSTTHLLEKTIVVD